MEVLRPPVERFNAAPADQAKLASPRASAGQGDDDDGDVVLAKDPKIARARRWCVIFYNDDYTAKWFVVHVLEQFFHMNETTATAFMLSVHEQGRGVAGIYTRDVAETKAEEIMRYAREFGMPLKVTAESDEDDGS
jgi:ATP-dependent Clp protease adaptor protein ClpS